MNYPHFLVAILVFASISCMSPDSNTEVNSAWPESTMEQKPWTRWWWMGNAVSKPEIEKQLIALQKAGFGGVEITPIYGVIGNESNYIDFLSDEWMNMLHFTISKADELGMGVDMNLGTGWPFGGPQITPDQASSRLLVRKYQLTKGDKFAEKITPEDTKQNPEHIDLLTAMAFFPDGKTIDISNKIDADRRLDWMPDLDCEVIVLWNGKTRQKVKRAAPGGEGWTMDHFSTEALQTYLSRFDTAFSKIQSRPRAFFNDSYEVYGSSSTKNILTEFEKRRNYDLRNHLREFASDSSTEMSKRIQYDYRLTFSELLMEEFTLPWKQWSGDMNVLTRNQAHGSPANIIDLYAAVDIPECETFGSSYFPIPGLRRDTADIRDVDPDPVMLKFATSPANIYGKRLVSSETFTWLAEHFKTSLSQCKPEVEQIFLSGVNHVFFHGTTYSPTEAQWPGWLFYASVQFGPANSFWPHIKGMNQYIARCQSILQQGVTDSDLLVYWPYHETRQEHGRPDYQVSIHNIDDWLYPTDFYEMSQTLMKEGYLLDFATDKVVSELKVENGNLSASESGVKYKAIIVPACELMPVATMQKLRKLKDDGARIIFQDYPESVPGYYDFESRKTLLDNLISEFRAHGETTHNQKYDVQSIVEQLRNLGFEGENLAHSQLKFLRKKVDGDIFYFLVNHSHESIDQTISFNALGKNAVFLDPNFGNYGQTDFEKTDKKSKVRVQLQPGKTLFLKITDAKVAQMPKWKYEEQKTRKLNFDQPWNINFTNGGPELPNDTSLNELISWTEFKDKKTEYFSGQATYTNTFNIEEKNKNLYYLELGKVSESARVWVNGQEVAILWSIPFRVEISKYLKSGTNKVKIEVANLMANRIRKMDQDGIEWKIFHDANIVNIDYKPFDASIWSPMPSGLLGPVNIVAIKSDIDG